MKLLAFGCSFTEGAFGDGWPYRLGQLINCEVVNKGKGGVGNFYIVNQVYNTVHVHNECDYKVHFNCEDSLVMVMWSGMDRVDRLVSKKEFLQYDEGEEAGMIRDDWINGVPNSFLDRFHTEEDSYIQTLQHMLGVQEFLINRNIPYLFLTFKDIFTNRYGKYKRAKKLEDNIIWDSFHFPNGEFGGLDEWVEDYKLHPRLKYHNKSFSHPSLKMHNKFAEYLYNLEEFRYLFT